MAKITLYPLRDSLWGFPEKVHDLYKNTRPILEIFIYILLAIFAFRSLSAPFLFTKIQGRENDLYSEGIVGNLETLNPIFVTGSDIDRAVFSLLYTKFIEIDKNGDPHEALVKEWEVTEEGKKIRFILNDDLYWHDGEMVNSDDVLFTFQRAIDMAGAGYDTFGSTLSGLKINADSDFSLLFEFDESIQNIFEVLSVYIVPEHIFSTLDIRESYSYGLNGDLIGSGKYELVDLDDNSIELSDSEYDKYSPMIKTIRIEFFNNMDQLKVALKNGFIDGIAGLDPQKIDDILQEYSDLTLYKQHVNQRKKLLYFNLRNELFADPNIRYGLTSSIDKERLVEELYFAYEQSKNTWSSLSWAYDPDLKDYYPYDINVAKEYFKNAGYEIPEGGEYLINGVGDRLTFDVAYVASEQNSVLSKKLKDMLKEVGVEVNLVEVTYSSLVNELLATRNFDTIMMEIEINKDPDQYNLWHSTKVNYPDLNISGYENNRVDIMLERARSDMNRQSRKEDYFQIQKFIVQDAPVIVLYEPAYNFVIKERFKGIDLENITFPYERFHNIEDWTIE